MQRIDEGHVLLSPGEGELIEVAGNRILIKVASPTQLVCDYSAAPSFPGPPLHVHPGFDESYLVLEGHLEVLMGEQSTVLAPGALAYVNGSMPHTFRNPTAEPVRFLSLCSPGGFEDFFRALVSGNHEQIEAVSERFGYRSVEPAP